MKKVLLIVSVFAVLCASASSNTRLLTGEEANNKVTNSEIVRFKHFTDVPNYVKFRKGKELPFTKLESWLNQFYQSDAQYGLHLLKKEVGKLGTTHYRYKQTINNTPIELSAFNVHVKNGKILSLNGEFFSDVNASTSVVLSESTALNQALDFINAEVYKWEIKKEEDHLKWEQEDPTATYYPKAEFVFVNEGGLIEGALKKAYKFNIYAQQPFSRREIYVDAANGAILWEQDMIHEADVVGTANTVYSGTQTITCDDSSGPFRLQETGRGNGIRTFTNGQTTNYSNVDITNNSANWTTTEAGLDAHWGAEMTYDYYLNVHGRNSIDGNGFRLDSYVHHDDQYSNAFWDGQRMTYGDGNGNNTPYTALDVAGHEVTHGLTSNTANLVYQDESGAINESFSDIFGISIEFINRPAVADWVLGDDLGFVIRNMENPNSEGDPDTYFGTNWKPLGGADNGGVHSNSGVQNFWFVLLVDGGSGVNDNGDAYSVNSLGLTVAGEIAYRNLTIYLTPTSNYDDARFYAIQSAVDLFGGCSDEVQEVTNAWYAVGVGPEYVDFTLSDFDTPIDSSCTVPFTANFNNLSLNGATYDWSFGDGNTSSQYNPSNTYTSYGTYTVELIVNGDPGCGNDTLEKVGYIVIADSLPCISSLPSDGAGTTQTGCTGILYDSGGPNGNYGANEDAQITISPVGAATIDLTFVNFDIEAGSNNNCDYDYMNIYDGPNTGSPLIGKYCNDNVPTTLSSTTGSLTILFHSDGGVEDAGFKIEWECNLATQAPVTDFSYSNDTTCNGEIFFNDLSANAPSSWYWDFGDGNSSVQKDPSHTYMSNGLFTVELTTTNAIGSHTTTKTDIIFVDYPNSPSVVGDSICENTSANLSATGSGILNWYSTPSGVTPINTGNTYTTPNLTQTATYYVEDVIVAPTFSLGKLNDSGSGGNFDNQQHLIFDVYKTIKIVDVQVYASTTGLRIVELRNSFGTSLAIKVVNLTAAGQQTVTLNFEVEPGEDYELGIASNSPNIDLYRSNGSVNYPYTLGGLASIKHSSANQNGGLNHYYFFYDWNVKEIDCISLRTPVEALVDVCTSVEGVTSGTKLSSFVNNSNQLELNFKNLEGTYNLMVLNGLGQSIINETINITNQNQSELIDILTIAKGLYHVKIYNSEKSFTTKFVK